MMQLVPARLNSQAHLMTDLSVFLSTMQDSLDGSVSAQLDILGLYTRLMQHWGMLLLLADPLPQHAPESHALLVEHVDQLSLTLLQTSPTEETYHKTLDFYERAAYIYSKPRPLRALRLTIPPLLLVYTLQFDDSLATVSRLCTILTAYKQACGIYMSNAAKKIGPVYDKKQVNTFNGFLMDICNCLWRGKAFTKSDAHARGCMVSDGVIASLSSYVGSLRETGSSEMALNMLFTMSYSPLLCLQSLEHLRQLEDREDEEVELQARHAGPITQKSLVQLGRRGGLEIVWQDYRLGVLRSLEDKKWNGISELMYSTMKNLLDARNKA